MNEKLKLLLSKLESIEKQGDFSAISEEMAMSLVGGYNPDGPNLTCNANDSCQSNGQCQGNGTCSGNAVCNSVC